MSILFEKEKKSLLDIKKYSLSVLKTIYKTRFTDEKMNNLVKQNKGTSFFLSAKGHEIVGASVSLFLQDKKDWALPYFRDRGFAIGFGCPLVEIFAAFLAREIDNHSGGRMMLDHFSDKGRRIPCQSSVVGSQFLQATGIAKGIKLRKENEIVYVSAGDGATSQGDFHEALNFSSIHKLPILFVIQDNGWAISTPSHQQTTGGCASNIAKGYANLDVYKVNGKDHEELIHIFQKVTDSVRTYSRPCVLVVKVPRLSPHAISDNSRKYRSKEKELEEAKQDPLIHLEKWFLEKKYLTLGQLEEIKIQIKQEVELAAQKADKLCFPKKETATHKVFKELPLQESSIQESSLQELLIQKLSVQEPSVQEPSVQEPLVQEPPSENKKKDDSLSEEIVMKDALNKALEEEMRRDPNVIVFGQDVAHNKGGVFGITTGLTEKFTENRCFNTPLAESTIVGIAIGLCFDGKHKPVAEIQFSDYCWTGMNQLINELSSIYYRSNGQWHCPVVLRMTCGGYIQGGPYHSQSIEAIFTHTPGLKVVIPSNASDAKRLLKTAIRDPNPVIFLEHKALYRRKDFCSRKEPGENELLPFGKAKIVKEGHHVTLVGWGMTVVMGFEVAQELEKKNISVEVIDLRTLNPLDMDTILTSLKKTGKGIIVHEAVKTGGFGAEIVAKIMEKGFDYLDAPIVRVAAKDCPVAFCKDLEDEILPQKEDIKAAIEKLFSF